MEILFFCFHISMCQRMILIEMVNTVKGFKGIFHVLHVRCQGSGVKRQVSGVRCPMSYISIFFFTKCMSFLMKGLLSTGPIRSSF